MPVHVCTHEGVARHERLTREHVSELLAAGPFWLDLDQPNEDELRAVAETLDFHPLAVEDSEHFDQRPKIEDYDSHVFLVLYGWAPDEDGLVEVHAYYTEQYLVTVRRDESPGLADVRRRYEHGDAPAGIKLLYRIADALVDSFFDPIERFDDRLDLIEDQLIATPKQEHLRDIFTMKRRLAVLRRAITPQRDLLAKLAAGAVDLPGMTPEAERYFRDVYDHLLRLTEMLDTQRDLMTAAVDVYLSSTSNRMNEVMKQLTVIASVFLPLTFVTGYFGQNFGWLVSHVGGFWWFLALGIGAQLATVAALMAWFQRRGWF